MSDSSHRPNRRPIPGHPVARRHGMHAKFVRRRATTESLIDQPLHHRFSSARRALGIWVGVPLGRLGGLWLCLIRPSVAEAAPGRSGSKAHLALRFSVTARADRPAAPDRRQHVGMGGARRRRDRAGMNGSRQQPLSTRSRMRPGIASGGGAQKWTRSDPGTASSRLRPLPQGPVARAIADSASRRCRAQSRRRARESCGRRRRLTRYSQRLFQAPHHIPTRFIPSRRVIAISAGAGGGEGGFSRRQRPANRGRSWPSRSRDCARR